MSRSRAMKEFSKNLNRVLEQRGWSKQMLADKCRMDRGYISKLISGEHSPSLELAEKIAKACECELFELLTPDFSFEVHS